LSPSSVPVVEDTLKFNLTQTVSGPPPASSGWWSQQGNGGTSVLQPDQQQVAGGTSMLQQQQQHGTRGADLVQQQHFQQQQYQWPELNNSNYNNTDLRKILSDSGRIIQTKITKVKDLLELIMEMATLNASVVTFYGELTERIKVLVYVGKLAGLIRSMADEVILKMDGDGR
jgi:hypothetical protein